jgi:hypothetical protein
MVIVKYFLPSIKHVTKIDVSRHKMYLDTSILAACFMERREYQIIAALSCRGAHMPQVIPNLSPISCMFHCV